MNATRITLVFMTRYGLSFTVRFHVSSSIVDPDNAAVVAIVDKINALCASTCISIELSLVANYVASAGVGDTTCEDKAVIVVPDSSGEKHTFKIPAPKVGTLTTIFGADNATLDLTNDNVEALSAALVAVGTGRAGDTLTAITKGHRAGGKALAY